MSIMLHLCVLASILFALVANGAPSGPKKLQSRSSKSGSDKLVFSHFIVRWPRPLDVEQYKLMACR